MAGKRFTAKGRMARRRIRREVTEEKAHIGLRQKVGKHEADHALAKAGEGAQAVRGKRNEKDKKRLRYEHDRRPISWEEIEQAFLDEAPEENSAKPDEEKRPKPQRLLEKKDAADKEIQRPSDKQKQQRKQAETFRSAAKEAETVQDSIEEIYDKEVERTADLRNARKKSRLRHGDDSSGMVRGAGSIAKKTVAVAAAPAKQYLRHEAQEMDGDNAAIQAVSESAHAGKRAKQLMNSSRRKGNYHESRAAANKAEMNNSDNQKRKADDMRAYQKKKRHKAAVLAKQKEASATSAVNNSIPAKAKKAVQTFISEHKGSFMCVGVLGLMLMLISVSVSSCAAGIQGSGTAIIQTTYASADQDIYAAENAYCALEDTLNAQINAFERAHPGYDDYEYQIDEIEHNPYHLISYLQAKYGGFVYGEEIKAEINRLFRQQYQLAVSETSETRTRMETVTETRTVLDPDTGEVRTVQVEVEKEVEYEHKTIYAMLTNKGFEMVARNNLTDDQLILYDALNRTYGNRPNLFDLNSIGNGGSAGINYTIPPEALSDEKFRNIIIEAEKYLGYPYVWGGKNPRTSFDCSGFVCWVLNHCANNWDVGQKRAKELCRMCTYVSPSEARSGDLIFFEKTYDTDGASHVGIYVGDGMMIHCGNPIKYSSINTRYFKEHFLCFGRLPFYDDVVE